ncbi:hypothetical protein Tco_1007826 [Tanacetum coccineum]
MNIMRLVSYMNVIPMKPIGTVLFSSNDVTKGPVLTVNIKGPVSFAKLVTREPRKKTVNFRTLLSPASNRSDVAISLESVRAVSEHFANSVYGFFLGKRVAYPVVENYVKNTWSKYGLVKSIMNSSNRLFFFQFSSKYGIDAMLDNGHCEDGLSVIATKLGTPLMLDSYTSTMCTKSWGRCSTCKVFDHVLDDCPKQIVLDVLKNLNNLRQAVRGVHVGPKLSWIAYQEVNNSNPFDAFNSVENDDDLGTKRGNSKLAEKMDNSSVVSSDHGTSSEAFDSDREVEEVFNENAGFMASTSSKVENYSKSGSGVESTSMYEQWRETYNEDSYADDDFDDCGLTNALLKLANAFDISLHGQL